MYENLPGSATKKSMAIVHGLAIAHYNAKKLSTTPAMPIEAYAITIRLIGYGFLLYTVVDFGAALIPPQFTNPAWEFQFAGRLVELVWFPILGFGLVFAPVVSNQRGAKILAALSWCALALAILYFALLPLLVINTIRLERTALAAFNITSERRTAAYNELTQQLEALSPSNLENLLRNPPAALRPPAEATTPNTVRAWLLQRAQSEQAEARQRAETQRNAQRTNILRSSVKWCCGALLSSLMMFYIWQFSGWARLAARREFA
ncbi:MAG: hypothetical protein HC918_11440 [Oscillatoriales cyanobacterium SM2_1_8]|nr:hypothetical protein [Oscillatoriales cyanobacterium SM2_1_8]